MTVWNKVNKELYNKHLTYDQNNQNGCNLPPKEGYPVLIYDMDKPRYFVGRINPDPFTGRLEVTDTIRGAVYSGVRDYIRWAEFDYYEKD